MFMDISSEMIHALLPVFLTSVLGASMELVGVLEGVSEATASITKVFSGYISDRVGNRKVLAGIGYGMGALAKPFIAMAPTTTWIFAAKFGDRLGKGVRGAPRDALVADYTPTEMRGAAYGLRQSLDTVGSFIGPIIALALMWALPGRFRTVFWLAAIPAAIAVMILIAFVKEPPHSSDSTKKGSAIQAGEISKLGAPFWRVVTIGGFLTLARFSEAFLVLRAINLGLTVALVPIVLILMNLVYTVSAYPFGALSDRIGRRRLMAPGFAVLIVADLAMAANGGIGTVLLGIALWGLHMGITQGVLSALVADTAPKQMRGTAFGLFNFVCGIAMLVASVFAGWLWQIAGPQATFLAGAAFTAVGLAVSALPGRKTA